MRIWLRAIGFLSLGLAAGAALGLYLGWVAWPTEFTDANPSLLQDSYQRDYLLMIASTYENSGDLAAARRRVDSLGDNGMDLLFSLMLDTILRAEDDIETFRLVHLAADLGLDSPAMEPYLTGAAGQGGDGT